MPPRRITQTYVPPKPLPGFVPRSLYIGLLKKDSQDELSPPPKPWHWPRKVFTSPLQPPPSHPPPSSPAGASNSYTNLRKDTSTDEDSVNSTESNKPSPTPSPMDASDSRTGRSKETVATGTEIPANAGTTPVQSRNPSAGTNLKDRLGPQPPPRSRYFPVLFYIDNANPRGLDSKPAEGEFWYLEETAKNSGKFRTVNGSMRLDMALYMETVLGYIRIASLVPRKEALKTLITKGDWRVNCEEGMSSEIYVFAAVDRLREWGIVQGYFDGKMFIEEIDRVGDEWLKAGDRDEREPAPMVDCGLCMFIG